MEDTVKRDLKGRFVKGCKDSDFEELRLKNLRLALTGKSHSEYTREKIRQALTGKKLSEYHKNKLRLAKLGKKGSETNRWVGDKVTNKPLHRWVRKYLPKPKLCEFCNIKPPVHLANMTGVYNREFHNWKYLCAKCHWHYDRDPPTHRSNPQGVC